MLALPKSPFVAIGILEALGVAVGMSAGGILPELWRLKEWRRQPIEYIIDPMPLSVHLPSFFGWG